MTEKGVPTLGLPETAAKLSDTVETVGVGLGEGEAEGVGVGVLATEVELAEGVEVGFAPDESESERAEVALGEGLGLEPVDEVREVPESPGLMLAESGGRLMLGVQAESVKSDSVTKSSEGSETE